MRKLLLCACCLLFFQAGLSAQSSTDSPFGVAVQAGVSHAGWTIALVGQYHFMPFSAYVGPSISLNRGLPPQGPLGLNAGMNWHIPSQKDWLGSIVNLDYQLHRFRGPDAPDWLQQFHLSYGLQFNVREDLFLIQQLGYGLYLEHAWQEGSGSRKTFTGYDGLVRLGAGYRF